MNEYAYSLIRTHAHGDLVVRLAFALGYLTAAGHTLTPALWNRLTALPCGDTDLDLYKATIDAYYA